MGQSGGLSNNDMNAQISDFVEIYDTFKHNKVCNDVVQHYLFLFSLWDKVNGGLNSLPSGSFIIGDELA